MIFWGSDVQSAVDQLKQEVGVKRFAHPRDVARRKLSFQVSRGIGSAQENGGNHFSSKELMELISEFESGRIRKVIVQNEQEKSHLLIRLQGLAPRDAFGR